MENLGIVGFTGAGANRLFAALTGLAAPSEYEAAVGIAPLPDERLDRLAAMSKSKKVVPAGFELVHVALPPGAKPGEGLGSQGARDRCATATRFSSCCARSTRVAWPPIPKTISSRSSSSS